MRMPGRIEQVCGVPVHGSRYDRSDHQHETHDELAELVSPHDCPRFSHPRAHVTITVARRWSGQTWASVGSASSSTAPRAAWARPSTWPISWPSPRQAVAAGKHIFVEKPTAPTVDEAMELARLADRAGLKHGVIQDKLFLPGYAKLLAASKAGFFGRILSVKIDAGSWIFDGSERECQRPSWNYKKAQGGGLALDMMAHWRYMIDRLASPITDVCAVMTTAIPERIDEGGQRYKVDAEDTNYALVKLQGGAIGVITNSWATRPRRDDTMVVQIDGTNGSAVAGRFRCFTQSAAETPEAFIKAARPGGVDLMADWKEVPDAGDNKNPFRQCWEAFLRHVGEDAPYLPTLVEGAKAVQLADLAYRSVAEQRWMTVPELSL